MAVRISVPQLNRDVRVLHITDTHFCQADPGSPNEAACRKRVADWERMAGADYARAAGVLKKASVPEWDAVTLSGDIIDFPSRATLNFTAGLLSDCPNPRLYTAGNHDWNFPGEPQSSALRAGNIHRLKDLFQNRRAVLFDRIEVHGLQILSVDNSTYQILPEQLAFAREQLGNGKPSVLVMHIPMELPAVRVKTIEKWEHPILMGAEIDETIHQAWGIDPPRRETAEFIELARAAKNLRAILCGHVHFEHIEQFSPTAVQIVTAPGFAGGWGEMEFVAGTSK